MAMMSILSTEATGCLIPKLFRQRDAVHRIKHVFYHQADRTAKVKTPIRLHLVWQPTLELAPYQVHGRSLPNPHSQNVSCRMQKSRQR